MTKTREQSPDFFDAVESAIGDMQGTPEYRLGFDRGLASANRWWAERFIQRKTSYIFTQPDHIWEEMEARAREILRLDALRELSEETEKLEKK